MIRLTALSQQLLPAQVRLTGSFEIRLVRENADGSTKPMTGTLQVHHETEQVRCHLRTGLDFNTLNLPHMPPDLLAVELTTWIEDCANGRLERAA